MTDLLAELEQTLAQLEIIRDSVAVPDAQLIRQISDLYDQQQRLLESEISAQTSQYQQAAQAMKEEAAKARSEAEAISDVAGLINTVASALEAVEGLLG